MGAVRLRARFRRLAQPHARSACAARRSGSGRAHRGRCAAAALVGVLVRRRHPSPVAAASPDERCPLSCGEAHVAGRCDHLACDRESPLGGGCSGRAGCKPRRIVRARRLVRRGGREAHAPLTAPSSPRQARHAPCCRCAGRLAVPSAVLCRGACALRQPLRRQGGASDPSRLPSWMGRAVRAASPEPELGGPARCPPTPAFAVSRARALAPRHTAGTRGARGGAPQRHGPEGGEGLVPWLVLQRI
mmetsp:Transcript_976/g.2430  ORF Transcript_976/g.2430 Transcript_976/m.2430 type:complete len:246 (-) Transcript_976:1176-1913(-)